MRWPLGLVAAMLVTSASAAMRQAPIVNGVATVDHPAVGALLFPGEAARASLLCSGTLIGCRTLLTAAHCVERTSPSSLVVYFQHFGFAGVSAITVHPDYRFPTADLAVLTLSTTVTGIAPAAIDVVGGQAAGSGGTIVGFGRSGGTSQDYGLKRQGRVTLSPCSGGLSDASSICWVFAPPIGAPGEDSNTCNGDSGGPLLLDGDGTARVAGVTSGGSSPTCLAVDLSHDTRVSAFASFVLAASGGDGGGACSSLPEVGSADTTVSAFAGLLDPETPEATHALTVAPGADLLRVTMNAHDDGSDFDLYVRAGSPPTTTAYDCAADGSGQFAACEVSGPQPGPWYVLVRQYVGSGGYQVTATTFTSLCADPANDGAACDDGNACTVGEHCTGGRCAGGATLVCDDGITCTADTCIPATGCRHEERHDTCAPCGACDAAAGCVLGPRPDCRSPAVAGGSLLKLRDTVGDGDLLVWKWIKGAAVTAADLGTPATTTDYRLCLYDESGAEPSLVARAEVPSGGTCDTGPCWRSADGTLRYRNPARTPDGIAKLLIKPGAPGKATITLRGKGNLLPPLPTLPLALPLRVQLHADGAACFEARYGGAGTRRNDAATFVGHD
ncbi:MAG TPA: trypsin-like serine protease [Candidatus Limnocylindria bacterium]|nr:trypsin-like serine protease [Candidatus Limnocylindria bacterium]